MSGPRRAPDCPIGYDGRCDVVGWADLLVSGPSPEDLSEDEETDDYWARAESRSADRGHSPRVDPVQLDPLARQLEMDFTSDHVDAFECLARRSPRRYAVVLRRIAKGMRMINDGWEELFILRREDEGAEVEA